MCGHWTVVTECIVLTMMYEERWSDGTAQSCSSHANTRLKRHAETKVCPQLSPGAGRHGDKNTDPSRTIIGTDTGAVEHSVPQPIATVAKLDIAHTFASKHQ